MNDNNELRDQWLRDTENYFRQIQSYNSTVITVGYGTFFGLLLFLQGKVDGKKLLIAAILILGSAACFVGYELHNNIKTAIQISKIGNEGKRMFRYWAWYFVPSLLLAVSAVGLLACLFIGALRGGTQSTPASPPAAVIAK
jgi:hypothetical protein